MSKPDPIAKQSKAKQVIQTILNSSLVLVADLTEKNPNVFL